MDTIGHLKSRSWADMEDVASDDDTPSSSSATAATAEVSDRLPSVGSRLHSTARCKPCVFQHTDNGCKLGAECNFCHLCDRKEKRRREKVKADIARRIFGHKRQDSAGSSTCAPSQPDSEVVSVQDDETSADGSSVPSPVQMPRPTAPAPSVGPRGRQTQPLQSQQLQMQKKHLQQQLQQQMCKQQVQPVQKQQAPRQRPQHVQRRQQMGQMQMPLPQMQMPQMQMQMWAPMAMPQNSMVVQQVNYMPMQAQNNIGYVPIYGMVLTPIEENHFQQDADEDEEHEEPEEQEDHGHEQEDEEEDEDELEGDPRGSQPKAPTLSGRTVRIQRSPAKRAEAAQDCSSDEEDDTDDEDEEDE